MKKCCSKLQRFSYFLQVENKSPLRPRISGSKDVYEIVKKYWDEDKIEFVEQFNVLLLNRGNTVIGDL